MLTKLFFPEARGVRVDRVWREGETIHIVATTTRRKAHCPLCHRLSLVTFIGSQALLVMPNGRR